MVFGTLAVIQHFSPRFSQGQYRLEIIIACASGWGGIWQSYFSPVWFNIASSNFSVDFKDFIQQ
jgi:hypothetical protein